jgi:hypothetical protein
VACISRDGRKPASRASTICEAPDQHVGIPDRGDAVLLRALHADRDARAEVDRRRAPRLRQREERKGHQVLAVARRHVARQGAEQVELFALCTAAAGTAAQGWTWRWPPARRDQRARLSAEWCSAYSGSEVVSKLRSAAQASRSATAYMTRRPNLRKRAAADHALLFQRARRQAQVVGGFVVGEIALRLRGSSRAAAAGRKGAGRMV